jgi:signal transduction histidine kinase
MDMPDLFARVSDGIFAVNADWRCTFINAAGALLVGREASELVGYRIWDTFPEIVGSRFEQSYRLAFESQRSVIFEEFFAPLNVWFAIRVFPAPEGLTIYFQDVTERKRVEADSEAANQQLHESEVRRQALLGALLRVQEDERARIARDVHDDALQSLAAADLRLHVLRRVVVDAEATRRLDAAQAAVRMAIDRLRRLVFELEPAGLARRGLVEAIDNHLAVVVDGTGLRAEVLGGGLPTFPYRARLVVFRMVTNAIAQALDHASATMITVRLERDRASQELVVTVLDDGELTSGPAMTSVQEQLLVLEGTLTVGPASPDGPRPGNMATLRVREEALLRIEDDRESSD